MELHYIHTNIDAQLYNHCKDMGELFLSINCMTYIPQLT